MGEVGRVSSTRAIGTGMNRDADATSASVVARVGVGFGVVVPLFLAKPNWPNWLAPNVYTVASLRRAMPCPLLAAIAVTLVSPGIFVGVVLAMPVVRLTSEPSWPNVLRPNDQSV